MFELMDESIAQRNNNRFELSKDRIIGIRIIGQIFNVQSADCLGETNFVRINLMFELLGIRIINYKPYHFLKEHNVNFQLLTYKLLQ